MQTRTLLRTLGVAALFSASLASQASAAYLDFGAFSSGDQGVSSLSVGDATVTVTTAGTLYVITPGLFGYFPNYGGFCALAGGMCQQTNWEMTFDFAVSNLQFEVNGFGTGDFAQLSFYDGATLLGSQNITGDGLVDLSSYASITRLVLIDSSTNAGMGYGDFTYNPASTSGVPEPGSLSLLAVGLGALGWCHRRRSRNGR